MANLFTTILNMSLTACIIILIVLLARQCLKKVPKIFSYVLWSVVLFRLLCPISISLPVSILAPMSGASTSAGTSYTASMEYISLPERNESEQMQQFVPGENGTQGNAARADADVSTAPLSPIAPETSTSPAVVEQKMSAGEIVLTILGWVWVAGMVGVLGMTAWQTITLKRRLADAFIIRGNIFESDKIDTAFILGVINPKIYLPLGLPFDVQKAVVAHEQTHQRRGDHIVKLVSYIALAIHWFNPLVWLSFKLMCDDMEKSCDEAVIRTMNSRGYTEKSVKKAYSEMLFALGGGKQHIFSPVSFAEHSTKERIKNIVAYKHTARNISIALCVVCVLTVLLCSLNPTNSVAALEDDSTENQNSPEWIVEHEIIEIGEQSFYADSTSISLYNINKDTDLSALGKCKLLQELSIKCDSDIDLSVLEELPSLSSLSLSPNNSEQEKMELRIPNISALNHIVLSNYKLESLSFWDNAPNINTISLCYCDISGLKFPNDASNLQKLEFISNTGFDTSTLNSLTDCINLNELIIEQSELEAISFLTNFPNLQSLDISACNEIKDYSPLEKLVSITKLEVPENGIIAASKLPNLISLNTSFYPNNLPVEKPIAIQEAFLKMTNLEKLELPACGISDLSFTSNMTKLKYLDVRWNDHLTDISALSENTSLEQLYISYCDISDISSLHSMTGLIYIDICGNPIDKEQIDNLSEMLPDCSICSDYGNALPPDFADISIETPNDESFNQNTPEAIQLTIGGTTFSSDVQVLRLSDIEQTDIEDLKLLSKCPNLEELHIGYTVNLNDFSWLSDIKTLKRLYFSDGVLTTDLFFLKGLSKLETLNMGLGVSLPNDAFSSLAQCPDLKELIMPDSQVTDLSFVYHLNKLEKLDIFGCMRITDYSPLSELRTLRSISVETQALPYISALPNLTEVNISSGNLTPELWSELSNLHQIERLEMYGCNIDDLTPLANLTSLRYLNLSYGENITDVTPLKNLTNLEYLNLCNCNVSDITPLANLSELFWLDISVNNISDVSCLVGNFAKNAPTRDERDPSTWAELNVEGNNLTDAQIQELRKSLPNCSVYANF